jgi:hypothetical protein
LITALKHMNYYRAPHCVSMLRCDTFLFLVVTAIEHGGTKAVRRCKAQSRP